ncbi:maltokinase N-terminal cap-like domain-containing protein [Nocardioides sp.]|uniref:maltokinase N-terminal cap-like domain-containing protein n=1 Tax=Nocardioides sp. TaxID=35761 RepID=UPI002ED12676
MTDAPVPQDVPPDDSHDDVMAALTGFVRAARWFGGKGRPFAVTRTRRLGSLATRDPDRREPVIVIDLATLVYSDDEGGEEYYQLPLALYSESQSHLEHAHLGQWDDAEHGAVHVYDALHDRDAMGLLLEAFAHPPEGGTLTFHRLPGHDLDLDTHSTLLTGEQSNSSVAFGEDSLLKVFRKVTPGRNPDITVHEVLTRAESEHVAALYGWMESVSLVEGEVLHLAMLQQFLRTASDGWELALASIRNLFAEGDLHAAEVGGDFAAEAARLGEALREVHDALAEHFPTYVRTAEELADLSAGMHSRLDAAIEIVPELAEHAARLRAIFDRVAGLAEVRVQQIHADLHLGQTLRTVKGWKIVDFEGEPAKPLADRVLPDSPWRDVAGMLRSFDYAPRVVERTFADAEPIGIDQRAFRAHEWSSRNRNAFLAAYAERPLTPDEDALLAAYVADKAVYEAVYEARNRPAWVSIPLAALAELGDA